MKVKPVGNQLLVELENVEEVSDGGIILSQKEVKREQDGQDIGEIIAFGPLVYFDWEDMGETAEERAESWGVKIGDKVIFHRYDGNTPRIEGYENHRLIGSNCIIAKVEA